MLEQVREFHETFNCGVGDGDYVHDYNLRVKLHEEEAKEFRFATYPEHSLKELCDLLYVAFGTAIKFGWDIEEAFDRVHQSNMSKAGEDGKPIVREDGKILKGPNYFEPNLEGLIEPNKEKSHGDAS